jgi:lysophosphatidate acyltransferase
MGLVTVIAKREILFSGPFGVAALLCGLIFIKRGSTNETRALMKEAIKKLKPKKTKLWMFPEGREYFFNKILCEFIIFQRQKTQYG